MNTLLSAHAIAAAALFASVHGASANLVVNGGFEDNQNNDSTFNMSNAAFTASMAGATAFGGANEIDIVSNDDLAFDLRPTPAGGWSIAIHSSDFTGESDALSLSLTESLMIGQRYRVELLAVTATAFDPGSGPLDIGLSSDATSFGTLVHSVNPIADDGWAAYSAEFIATEPSDFLTFLIQLDNGAGTWVQLDEVSLTLVPAPATTPLLVGFSLLAARRRRL